MASKVSVPTHTDLLAAFEALSQGYVTKATELDLCRRRLAAHDTELSDHAEVVALRENLVRFSDSLHQLANELVRFSAATEQLEGERTRAGGA